MWRRLFSFHVLTMLVGAVVTVLLFYGFFSGVKRNEQRVAEVKPSWAERGPFAPMLVRMDGFERASVPEGGRWRMPLGTELAAMSYDAQPFAEMNEWRGGRHTGSDWNGIGQENTDVGVPIWAPYAGRVMVVTRPSEGWGLVALVAHRVEGELVTSLYAHLDEAEVGVGQNVEAGQLLGRVGSSAASDFAHLHWELRRTTGLSVVETAYEQRPSQEWVQWDASAWVSARVDEGTLGWPRLGWVQWRAGSGELLGLEAEVGEFLMQQARARGAAQ